MASAQPKDKKQEKISSICTGVNRALGRTSTNRIRWADLRNLDVKLVPVARGKEESWGAEIDGNTHKNTPKIVKAILVRARNATTTYTMVLSICIYAPYTMVTPCVSTCMHHIPW